LNKLIHPFEMIVEESKNRFEFEMVIFELNHSKWLRKNANLDPGYPFFEK